MSASENLATPIRIAVDARPYAIKPCGFSIYLTSIIEPLRRAGFDLTLLSNQPFLTNYPEAAQFPSAIFGPGSDVRWEHVDLPRYLKRHDFDLYFSGFNRGVPAQKARQTRYIMGMLDIIPFLFPQYYFFHEGLLRFPRRVLRGQVLSTMVGVARADAIVTISEASARDIRRFFHRRNVTSHLIRLQDVAPPPPREPKNQFVYIGGVDSRKKIDVLVRAFGQFSADHPDYKLVFIGHEEVYRHSLDPLIESLELADRVEFAGFVSHDRKFEILNESRAVVYPSIYEGYGMAIAEGMQAQVPVIAGTGGSQAEVGGVAVRHIDPLDPADMAEAMREMLDPATRAEWIARGREQLKVLTDERIETDLVAYFREQGAISRRRRRPGRGLPAPAPTTARPEGQGFATGVVGK